MFWTSSETVVVGRHVHVLDKIRDNCSWPSRTCSGQDQKHLWLAVTYVFWTRSETVVVGRHVHVLDKIRNSCGCPSRTCSGRDQKLPSVVVGRHLKLHDLAKIGNYRQL